MNVTLDRKRDFGSIHGEHEHGAMFEQDGFLFNAQGVLIREALDEKALERLAQREAQEAALERARATFREVMPDASAELVNKLITADNLNLGQEESDEIDLAAWAMGSQKYVFGKVTAEIRKRFNQSPVNKGQALEILAQHGVIASAPGVATIPAMT